MWTRALVSSVMLAAVVLQGCATRQAIPLTDEATGKIRSTDVVIRLTQQEIAAEINPSNLAGAAGGGLILALIDVAVTRSRADDVEKSIAPIKNALVDYDFSSQLKASLEQELGQMPWINLQGIRTETSPDPKKLDDTVAHSSASAVLVVDARYSVSPDFSLMNVKAAVTAYPKTEELIGVAKKARPDVDPPLLYRNTFQEANGNGGPYPDRDAAANAWAENNGKAARDALNKDIADLAKHIVADLAAARARQQKAESGDAANTVAAH